MTLLKKIISTVLGKKLSAPMTGNIAPMAAGRFIEIGDQLTWIPDNLDSYVVNGYQANDIIYSIINMIMDKIKVAPWGLYKVVDEQALKQYNSFLEQKNWMEAARCRKKALEPLVKYDLKAGRLNELLKWPNERETWNDQVAANAGFVNIVGNNYTWGNLLETGANQGLPGELFNLPAQHMVIRSTSGWPQRITGYQLNAGNIRNFTKEQILHEKLFNPSYSISGAGLYGQSPIKAAVKTATRNNSSKQAASVQFQNNGPPGIAFIDDPVVPVQGREAQAKAVKKSIRENYTGSDKFNDIPISGYKMGYVSIGTTLSEMALTDVEQVDLRILCNVWGLPSQMLNDPENKSFNNAREAEKALTTRCALPRLTSIRNNFNRKIQTDWGFKGVNVYVDFDMSVYTELQEDQATKWGWVDKLPVSIRYKLEMMGLDVPDDPNMDVILVAGNLVPLADIINTMSDAQLQQVDDELNKAGLRDYLRIAK